MLSLLAEDHREAYFFWKQHGLSGACVHVDAHLDTCEFHLPGYTGVSQPEINCGNYLLHALREGIVRTLVWVVPAHLPGPDRRTWVREEVQAWLHPTLEEDQSWYEREGRLEGRLKGCRTVVCTSDRVPPLQEPVLLDIDVDYFLGPQDEVWQTPEELAADLSLTPEALTVAYSVEGGYTPVELRWLGPRTLEAWGLPAPDETSFVLSALDEACFYLQRKRYDECLASLERVEGIAGRYLKAFVLLSQGAYPQIDWLLDEEHDPATRRHLLEMQGRTHLAMGRHAEAVESFRAATRLEDRDVSLWLELGRAQLMAGLKEEAARTFRRGIGLNPDLLISVQAQLELARLYFQLGQRTLAQAQKKRLLEQSLPPALHLQACSLGLLNRMQ